MQVLLDACVALNLEATGELHAIANTLGLTFAMATKAAEETLYLIDLVDGETSHTQIDLDVHTQKGTLEILQLSPDQETSTFVSLAARVDDGEAQSLSLAIHRNLPLATDDRLAIKLARERGLAEPIGTTTLLQRYADSAGLKPHEITLMLITVERRASFRPPRGSTDLTWWLQHTSPGHT
jgi:predicted nucleic acid-binding protein